MPSARALFKFGKMPPVPYVAIDTTSSSGLYRELSPFVLPGPPAKLFENLWQFSKVYKCHLDTAPPGRDTVSALPNADWYKWRDLGFSANIPLRYPMGKGAVPEYTCWQDQRLGYIDARKKLYAPEYAKNVGKTDSFKRLQDLYETCRYKCIELILLDYDAYDHWDLGMTFSAVINDPTRKMGHAFVLLMMLNGPSSLELCINSPTKE